MSLNKIVIHWSAGSNNVCAVDKKSYHYIISGSGQVVNGDYKPEDNINCKDGKYAAHCGGGNTGAIGVSMAGMYGFNVQTKVSKYPLTKVQFDKCIQLCAELCLKYKIPVNNCMTHYEFGKLHPETSSKGKIDIVYLPFNPTIKQNEIGAFIRAQIRNCIANMSSKTKILR